MKIAALLMAVVGAFSLWIAFKIQFLKHPPLVLNVDPNFGKSNTHFGAFAVYYLACAVAANYFSTLFYGQVSMRPISSLFQRFVLC